MTQAGPPPRGTYEFSGYVESPGEHRRLTKFMLFFGSVFLAGGVGLLVAAAEVGQYIPPLGRLVGIGVPVWVLLWAWFAGAGPVALRVEWDERGLEVTKFFGPPTFLEWQQIIRIRRSWVPGFRSRSEYPDLAKGIVVVASGGPSFRIEPRGKGFDGLWETLQAHLHGAAGGSAGPATRGTQTECKWCGETFPAGIRECPQCGRPVP
jgi:hypothetical protein